MLLYSVAMVPTIVDNTIIKCLHSQIVVVLRIGEPNFIPQRWGIISNIIKKMQIHTIKQEPVIFVDYFNCNNVRLFSGWGWGCHQCTRIYVF